MMVGKDECDADPFGSLIHTQSTLRAYYFSCIDFNSREVRLHG